MATIEGETATTSEGIVESAVTADDDNDNDKEEDIGNDDNDNDNNDGIVPTKTKAQQQPATNNPPGLPVSTAIEFEPPLACVRRILKKTLPSSTNVGKDASAAFARACGIFIIYITACANDFARENRRQTITANDVLAAIKVCVFVCVFACLCVLNVYIRVCWCVRCIWGLCIIISILFCFIMNNITRIVLSPNTVEMG